MEVFKFGIFPILTLRESGFEIWKQTWDNLVYVGKIGRSLIFLNFDKKVMNNYLIEIQGGLNYEQYNLFFRFPLLDLL